MREYFNNIYTGLLSFWEGLSLTFKHMRNKEELVATLQYPNEKWPIPERNIGFDNSEYNVIRSRLHVDMDDCIGCLQCERACPVDCIKIDVIKPPKESEFDCGITSFGTQKKLLVPRFTIDMSECMYCNLCVYPCPEECIYMVGGPNDKKHEIDYEFSEYDRNGLIYEFATASDEDIVEVGGQAYIDKRDMKAKKITAGEELKGVEEPKEEVGSDAKKASKDSKSISVLKPDFTAINEIQDRVTRGIAKKAYTQKFKEKASFQDIADFVKKSLIDSEKFTDELIVIIEKIATTKISNENNEPSLLDAAPLLTAKSFNVLEDKMQRGLIKKIFIAEKKKDEADINILKAIRNELKSKDMLSDDVSNLLKELMLASIKKPANSKKEDSTLFDIKLLNDIDDKMARGMAKKIFIKGKKSATKSIDILNEIEKELKKTDKYNDSVETTINKIKSAI